MELRIIFVSAVLTGMVVCTRCLAGVKDLYCGETLNIRGKQTYSITSQRNTTGSGSPREVDQQTRYLHHRNSRYMSGKCVVSILAHPNYRVQLTVHYYPQQPGCNHGYLHIGNDRFRPDKIAMTSYKFCEKVHGLEIISHENFLWIVFDSINQRQSTSEIHVEAHPYVRCNSSAFECSPVQCVRPDQLCDGRTDCHNGRDEFCEVTRNGHKNLLGNVPGIRNQRVPDTDEPCFLCGDDSVICPTLPLYHEDRGKTMWFMCDGIDHCKDGSDERKDMCYRMKRKGRTGLLFKCIPHMDGSYHGNTSVLIWHNLVCDGVQHCRHMEDERSCGGDTQQDTFHLDPVPIVIVACTLVPVLFGAAIFIRKTGKKQPLVRRQSHCRDVGASTDETETYKLHTVAEEPEGSS